MPLMHSSTRETDLQASRKVKLVESNNETSTSVNEGVNEGEIVFKKRNQQFNANHYKVLYEELMNSSKGREIFQKYLKTEACSEEPILFLNDIDDLKIDYDKIKNTDEVSIKVWKKYLEKLIGIVDKFIRGMSNNELNLQKAQQEKILKKIDEEIAPHMSRLFGQTGNKRVSSPSSPSSPRSPPSSPKSSISNDSCDNSSYISARSAESMLEHEIQNYLNVIDPDVLFSEIILSVHVDLKLDQFPRFSRSKFLLDYLNEQGETFTRTIAIDISRGFNVDIRFLPKDLSRNFIYDKDIYFGFSLIEDSPDWQELHSSAISDKARLYHSNTSYAFGNNHGMKLYKMVTTLPYKLEDVFSAFCHLQSTDTGDSLTENRIIASNAPNQAVSMTGVDEKTNPLALRYVTSSLKLMLPGFKNREFPRSMTCVYDSGLDAYIHVGHSSKFSFYEISSDKIQMDIFLVNVMYRIREDLTRFVYVIYSDVHTNKHVDAIFAKLHWKKRCARLEQTFYKLLEKPSDLSDNFKLKELVEENQKVYPQKSWYRDYSNMFHKQ